MGEEQDEELSEEKEDDEGGEHHEHDRDGDGVEPNEEAADRQQRTARKGPRRSARGGLAIGDGAYVDRDALVAFRRVDCEHEERDVDREDEAEEGGDRDLMLNDARDETRDVEHHANRNPDARLVEVKPDGYPAKEIADAHCREPPEPATNDDLEGGNTRIADRRRAPERSGRARDEDQRSKRPTSLLVQTVESRVAGDTGSCTRRPARRGDPLGIDTICAQRADGSGLAEARRVSLPHVLQIRPTTRCPAHCATCTTLVTRDAPDLSLGEIDANLEFFVGAHGVDELVFSGAEITLRPDFVEILERVRRRSFRLVTLISSGLAWTEALASACAGVIDRVVVALTPTTAIDWRSPLGRSARVRRSIEMLHHAGVRVQSNTVLTAAAVEVLDELAESIEVLGMEDPIFLFPFATGGAEAVRAAGVPTWASIEPTVRRVLERFERGRARLPRLKNVPPCMLGDLSRFASPSTPRFLVEYGRQLERHALIPPFVGMAYEEACSRCARREQCDGTWPAYVEAGIWPAARPVTSRL